MKAWLGLAVLALLMPVWMTALVVGVTLWVVWEVAYSGYSLLRTVYLKRYHPAEYELLRAEGFAESQRIMAMPRRVRASRRR